MTITIDHNYKLSSVTMTVNGADFDLIPYPPSHPTNQRTVYSIPDSAITPPATIQVTATELVTGPVAGVPGVNRVVY